jgi:hypothetical protein
MVDPGRDLDSPRCGETLKKLTTGRPLKSGYGISKSESSQDTVNDFSTGLKIGPENPLRDATGPGDRTYDAFCPANPKRSQAKTSELGPPGNISPPSIDPRSLTGPPPFGPPKN